MRGNLLHTLSTSPFSQQQPAYKKEPYSYYTVRPKRVGYWKASYIKVTYFQHFVNGKFCRFTTTFAEFCPRFRPLWEIFSD